MKSNKIIGDRRDKKPKKESGLTLSLADYVGFEATNVEEQELTDHFLEWIKDDSYLQDYSSWEIVKPTKILVRVYRFEKQHEKGLVGMDGEPLTQIKILPFAKVILVGSEVDRFSPGDIIALPDAISDIETNGAWLEWKKIMDKERPQLDLPEPEKVVGMILDWRKASKFSCNKFNPSPDDEYTFIKNETDFDVKYCK